MHVGKDKNTGGKGICGFHLLYVFINDWGRRQSLELREAGNAYVLL